MLVRAACQARRCCTSVVGSGPSSAASPRSGSLWRPRPRSCRRPARSLGLAGALAGLVAAAHRGRQLVPAGPGRAEVAEALLLVGVPGGGALGLEVTVAWGLSKRLIQPVALGAKASGRHGAQVQRRAGVGGE